jgi:hypothetical protein
MRVKNRQPANSSSVHNGAKTETVQTKEKKPPTGDAGLKVDHSGITSAKTSVIAKATPAPVDALPRPIDPQSNSFRIPSVGQIFANFYPRTLSSVKAALDGAYLFSQSLSTTPDIEASSQEKSAVCNAIYYNTLHSLSSTIAERLENTLRSVPPGQMLNPELARPISEAKIKTRAYKALSQPQNEEEWAAADVACADMMRAVGKFTFPYQFQYFALINKILIGERLVSSIAGNSTAQLYLSLIFLHHKSPALKTSALNFLRASYAVMTLRDKNKNLEVTPENRAPWWHAGLCPSPEPDPVQFAKDTVPKTLNVVLIDTPAAMKDAGLENIDKTIALKAMTHLSLTRFRFLAEHAEVLSVARELGVWMVQDPSLLRKQSSQINIISASNVLIPEQAIAQLDKVVGILNAMRTAGHALPEKQERCTKLEKRLQKMDTASKVRQDLTSQLVYLLRNDDVLRDINQEIKDISESLDKKDRAVQAAIAQIELKNSEARPNAKRAARQTDTAKNSNAQALADKNAAELIALIEAEGAKEVAASTSRDRSNKNSKKKTKALARQLRPANTAASTSRFPSTAATAEGPNASTYQPEELLSDEGFSAVQSKRAAVTAARNLAASIFPADTKTSNPRQMLLHFQQYLKQVEQIRDTPTEVHIGGFEFYTRLSQPALAAVLPLVFDPGTFSNTIDANGVAASAAYHYEKHVLNRRQAWPGQQQLTIEHYIEQGLELATQPEWSAPPKPRVDKPSLTVTKRWGNGFFGLYTDRNLLLSYGPRQDLSPQATAEWVEAPR